MIELVSGGTAATLLPETGGALGSFRVSGRDILRPTPAGMDNPLGTACFPLVPYANRIADGRFTFAGRDHALPCNFAGFDHPLHGLGWIRPWTVEALEADRATLSCDHTSDEDWPWDWSAMQCIAVSSGRLEIVLTLTNRSDRAMPCALGLHPYFVRAPEARLRFEAQGVWLNDTRMIPERPAAADAFGDFARGAVPHAHALTDNCWFGWDGTAQLGPDVRACSPEAQCLHVYAPPGEDFLCLEPTTQMPDAFNRVEDCAVTLAPGGQKRLTMTLQVVD